ncbi:DNA (cytosine-5-)-methyltransferase [Mycoplasmopsis caviae]|uniref:Cytosine-specific methyltransferase n=1 Tax=Mycoplasmopsis caviae TaxID=55603 RepID=A0A3P8K9M6_9BACT|nr:DNA (cytosine-5-)-methyltransferase [Mycoplasmopsis caviae]UUD35076.1 DNA (cytosine-5-)-methyltransferase [Mycoplasmopsis caviae]VDR42099.1 Cytosine-specific DNA methyltransferase/Type II site-specific deoxyribonuclease [Mycoplasmopsis caviae]
MSNKVIKFIDLFSGMGGIRLGFEQAAKELGFRTQCILTSEIKDSALKVLKRNFSHNNLVGNITKVNANHMEDFDFLLAGFPCQSFSSAGKGLGFLDTRGTLFFEIEKILKSKKPYGFLLENVENLVVHDKVNKNDKIGRTFSVILQKLKSLGYFVNWKVLDSQDFGVAQSRKRIYILGTLNKYVDMDNFEIKSKKLKDILTKGLKCVDSHFTRCLLSNFKASELNGKAIKDKRGGKNNIHSWTIGLKGNLSDEQVILIEKLFRQRRKKHWAKELNIDWMDGMPLNIEQISTFHDSNKLKHMLDDMVNKNYLVHEHPKKKIYVQINNSNVAQWIYDESKPKGYNIVSGKLSYEFTKILDSNSVAPTLVATDVIKLGVVDNDGIRHLTIDECLKLFGYPEWYKLDMFEDNISGLKKSFDLLGNTVVVPVIYELSKRLLKCLE